MTCAYAVPNWWWSAQEIVNLMTIILSKMFLTKAEIMDSYVFVKIKLTRLHIFGKRKSFFKDLRQILLKKSRESDQSSPSNLTNP